MPNPFQRSVVACVGHDREDSVLGRDANVVVLSAVVCRFPLTLIPQNIPKN